VAAMTTEFNEELPTALPYLPPSEPPRPYVAPQRGYEPPPVVRKQEHTVLRTWLILGSGLLVGTILIVLKL
jgi:hypothetical protein